MNFFGFLFYSFWFLSFPSSFSINVRRTIFFSSTIYIFDIRTLLIRSFSICSNRYSKTAQKCYEWTREEEMKRKTCAHEKWFVLLLNVLAIRWQVRRPKTNGITRSLSSILAIIIIIIFQCNFINYSRDYSVLSSTRASACAGSVCWLPVAFHVLNTYGNAQSLFDLSRGQFYTSPLSLSISVRMIFNMIAVCWAGATRVWFVNLTVVGRRCTRVNLCREFF